MKTSAAFASILVSVIALTGCEETKRVFGKTKEAPDEFAVYRRAPLSLPPDSDLRPPTPGVSRPQVVNPRDQARAALGLSAKKTDKVDLSKSEDITRLSNGERALLALTGANKANPQIRKLVEEKTADLYETNETFTDKMVFWRSKNKGVALDPQKELKRIREAQSLGKPLNSKDIPSVTRKRKGLLEGIFD
ncbi:MAG TPA: DUF3035 domain-containing protein [Rhodospirillales bacterium]|nr:DUF3035 domain-containing protein [Rhodospirillales bacterium]HIC59694.1 DUF3035 domain-containing protein [Rhodospirillales bacterium]HIN76195.1 DUF3035 domain-containing protein [Rhodospirillales bacterium]HIP09805.1 DUF3035 domain-containing protein [Rhodospirillales bacterium]|tara:strand:- start:79 stop:654 length:576 start_codon:yes stop_codon:yes gene_type:complete